MKVLHIFDHSLPLHSGYTFRSAAILREQRHLGWETVHVTSSKHPGETLEEEVDGWHFYRTPTAKGFATRLPVLKQYAVVTALEVRLRELIPELRPDIIHAHSPALNGLAALRVGKRFKLPVIYEVRAFWEDAAVDHGVCRQGDLRYRLTRGLETYVLKHVDAVTTICKGLRDEIIARGIAADKIKVIPNAVDPECFTVGSDPDQVLARALGLEEAIVLGFIGSFYAYEGLDLLLNVLPTILEKYPEAKVLLVGGGFQEASLKQQAQRLGIQDRIIFTGRVPHEHIQRYYDLVDILIYPRRAKRITELVTPLKPLEAMAQGRLVLASDVGGHRELIRPGETGELFPKEDGGALADAVIKLLGDRKHWDEIKTAARRFVETERNWRASVARYKEVYPYLLAAPRERNG